MKILLVILLCFSMVLCSGCGMYGDIRKAQISLGVSRPENATKLPELSDAISEVRVTAVPRDCELSSEIYEEMGGAAGQRQYLQIYYGYCVDGMWTDLPCENYPLISVFNSRDYDSKELSIYKGYEAADVNHMVKIGPYLLISLEKKYQVSDSLGSEVELLFTEYDNSYDECDGMYGYLREDRDSVVSGKELHFSAADCFDARNYLIIEYASIQEGYALTADDVVGETTWRDVLTYDDIVYLLEKAG